MTENNGGPAFPVEVDPTQPDGRQTGNTVFQSYGMSLRDYFAAKALTGICASGPGREWSDSRLAAESYRLADAMLEARK